MGESKVPHRLPHIHLLRQWLECFVAKSTFWSDRNFSHIKAFELAH